MDTVPVDVVKYMLDNVVDTQDLVAFHRLSNTYAQAVDPSYWRHRVSKLIGIEIPPITNLLWNDLYYQLTKTQPHNYLRIMLRYPLPNWVFIEWAATNNPPDIVPALKHTTRFDLIPQLVEFVYVPLYLRAKSLDMSELEPTDPVVTELRKTLEEFQLFRLFLILLPNPNCPLSVIAELNNIYHFVKGVEHIVGCRNV
jgi:hypothetical protein